MKKLSDVIKKEVGKTINVLPLELLSLDYCETTDEKTGDKKQYVKAGVEVAKGSGEFSRCQFSVKIPNTTILKVQNSDLQNSDYQIFFTDLEVSYIDSQNNFYFRAADYDVEKE